METRLSGSRFELAHVLCDSIVALTDLVAGCAVDLLVDEVELFLSGRSCLSWMQEGARRLMPTFEHLRVIVTNEEFVDEDPHLHEFLACLSNEFRAPLVMLIRPSEELLEKGLLNDEQRELVERIRSLAQGIALTIDAKQEEIETKRRRGDRG